MRVAALEIFDDIISGTAGTWYTPAQHNETLSTDAFAVQACTSQVAATTTLTVTMQTSGDGQNWTEFSPDIGPTGVANDGSYWASRGPNAFASWFGLVRFKITLGGTNPACRLKLYFTGRSLSASGRAPVPPHAAAAPHK